MSSATSRLLICSCEKTMPLDAEAIGRGCTARIGQANQLCGLDLDRFKEALAEGSPITVASGRAADVAVKSSLGMGMTVTVKLSVMVTTSISQTSAELSMVATEMETWTSSGTVT